MDAITTPLLELLPVYGPGFLFLLVVLETCFITGLAFPSSVATSVATVLALQGQMQIEQVVIAALVGGFVGDTIGFWIGHWFGDRVLAEDGAWTRRLASRQRSLADLYGRHPFFSVTVARLISFVRTLMPMAAGAGMITYRRFLAYEMLGLVGWLGLYVSIGVLARESWEVATRIVGVGGTVVFVIVALVLWTAVRRATAGAAPTEDST